MKKERITTAILKRMTLLLCILMMGTLLSCSSDDDSGSPSTTNGKNVKLTITVNGVADSDYLSFVAVGGAASGASENTVWKVNGTALTDESGVSLGENDFMGSTQTYVIESVTPLSVVSVGMQFLTFGERSYTFSYKAEVNGEVVKEENNITVTATNDYTHDYTY